MTEFNIHETYDGVEELIASTLYTYTYDANGNVTEMVSQEYDYESQEYFPSERIVYGEYGDTAGIGSVDKDDADVWSVEGDIFTARAEGLTGISIYNVQGMLLKSVAVADGRASVTVSELQPGLYLLRAEGTGSTLRVAVR